MKRITIAAVAVWMLFMVPAFSAGPAAASCAAPPVAVAFVGHVTSIDQSDVTFRVDHVVVAPTEPDHLAVGDAVSVDHGDEAHLLEVDRDYRVQTWGPRDQWEAHLATSGGTFGSDDGCDNRLTTYADGTLVETGWFATHDVVRGLLVIAAVTTALIAIVEGTRAVRRRRLERR